MAAHPVILQIIPELGAGGAERTTIEVAEAVAAAGGTALVVSEGGRLEAELATAGGELIRFPAAAKNPAKILANARALGQILRERSVSLVHARSRAPAWSALIAARRSGLPFVTTYHGIYNQKGRLKSWYNSVMARADLVIANSDYTAKIVQVRHGTPPERLRVIPRGVDLERFSPDAVSSERVAELRKRWGVAPEARLVVLASRLTRWKGQHVAIGAAARVLQRQQFADVVFVLAGDDQGRISYREELTSRIEELGLSRRILLPGHCEDMPAAFAAASLSLVTSIEPEAFGRISVEAQAMGCPVIVSELGALPETVIAANGRLGETQSKELTGWTFPAGNAEALAEEIAAALSLSPERCAVMADAARYHAARTFSKQALQLRTLQVYDSLLNSVLAKQFGVTRPLAEDSQSWPERIPI